MGGSPNLAGREGVQDPIEGYGGLLRGIRPYWGGHRTLLGGHRALLRGLGPY